MPECQALGSSSLKSDEFSAHKTTRCGQLRLPTELALQGEALQSLPGNYSLFQGTELSKGAET